MLAYVHTFVHIPIFLNCDLYIVMYQVVLKETSSLQDMLRALFHVNYLYWLEKNAGYEARGTSADCKPGGRLQISLEYVQREFNHVKNDGESMGWVTEGLIARPLPNRVRLGYVAVPDGLIP